MVYGVGSHSVVRDEETKKEQTWKYTSPMLPKSLTKIVIASFIPYRVLKFGPERYVKPRRAVLMSE